MLVETSPFDGTIRKEDSGAQLLPSDLTSTLGGTPLPDTYMDANLNLTAELVEEPPSGITGAGCLGKQGSFELS